MPPNLEKYNLKTLAVEKRPPNFGKEITDNLPTVEIDPLALDWAAEIKPLTPTPRMMYNIRRVITKIEIPKWRKRSKTRVYGWGALKAQIRMIFFQKKYKRVKSKNKEKNLHDLKSQIKQYAKSLGYISGFTKVDRRFISNLRDDLFPYNTALILGMPMDWELIKEVPYPGKKLFDFETYTKSGRAIFKVADFIKSKGYKCQVRIPFDGIIKYIPHAVMAGLGELSAKGLVITREYGSKIRWGMIIIDADIEIDKPVDLNIGEYCDTCKLCIITCPGNAIPEERIWWRGVYKRKINDLKCWPYFVKYEGCGICIKMCPINRFGYNKCMEAFKKDRTILRNKALETFQQEMTLLREDS